jgi:hypothetical protein
VNVAYLTQKLERSEVSIYGAPQIYLSAPFKEQNNISSILYTLE